MTTVSLKQWGNSKAIRIPKKILDQANIDAENSEFTISVNADHEIILKKNKKPQSLKELFQGFDYKKYWASQGSKELDWNNPVGKEIF